MATKASKKAAAAASAMQTPVAASSSSSARAQSPLSPTRHNRLQEKVELQNLNDRLAAYIDRVRQLETENSRLSREIQTSQETITHEVTSIKSMYECELSDARKLLDETTKEKAKLEIDIKRFWEENEDIKAKLEKKTKDLIAAEKNSTLYEGRFNELTGKYNQSQTERKKAVDDAKSLEKDVEKLRNQLEDTRKQLEEEMLSRVDIENNIQGLKEELSIKEQIHSHEMKETRKKRQVEISELDGRLMEEYNAKLQLSLQELREQYEIQMKANREDIEHLYEHKMRDLKNQMQRNSSNAASSAEEFRSAKLQFEAAAGKITELESVRASLSARVSELERLLESERQRHTEDLALIEAEQQRMRDEMAAQLMEYQDLMDIKVALDLEIAAYQKLLESEEARLNITPVSSPHMTSRGTPARHTPIRGGKRKRAVYEESDEHSLHNFVNNASAKGDMELTEICPQGKFVKLHNKGEKEISLSGWQLVRQAGGQETVFKFHRSVKCDPDATICVWSADQGQMHEPPANIVMKGQKWFISDSMLTTLSNNEGEEMAITEQQRVRISASSSRHRELAGLEGQEELFFQRGDPPARDERCSIM